MTSKLDEIDIEQRLQAALDEALALPKARLVEAASTNGHLFSRTEGDFDVAAECFFDNPEASEGDLRVAVSISGTGFFSKFFPRCKDTIVSN